MPKKLIDPSTNYGRQGPRRKPLHKVDHYRAHRATRQCSDRVLNGVMGDGFDRDKIRFRNPDDSDVDSVMIGPHGRIHDVANLSQKQCGSDDRSIWWHCSKCGWEWKL